MTNDGLVATNQASGLAGTQLVPDLAVSLPTPTDGGKTYTFQLRPNIRYSNGRPVKASDVRSTFERDFEVQVPRAVLLRQHRRREARASSAESAATSRKASSRTTLRARSPSISSAADPEFLYKLSLPFAYVVPRGTPPHFAERVRFRRPGRT